MPDGDIPYSLSTLPVVLLPVIPFLIIPTFPNPTCHTFPITSCYTSRFPTSHTTCITFPTYLPYSCITLPKTTVKRSKNKQTKVMFQANQTWYHETLLFIKVHLGLVPPTVNTSIIYLQSTQLVFKFQLFQTLRLPIQLSIY